MQRVRVTELVDVILEQLGEVEWVEVPGTRRPRQLPVQYNAVASVPPADGTCHFDKLPAELLKAVFSASIPPRSKVIEPRCGGPRPELLGKREHRPNRVADLMVLSKKLCGHVAEMVYEERTFSIHVHQGQRGAGIEFLHVGRQPLQYQADVKDGRFAKFSPGEIFGFSRIKKLDVRIYPGDGQCRHTAINTYYMLHVLVNLLSAREDNPGNRITALDIGFVANYPRPHAMQGRSTVMVADSPWWDEDNNKPRETSFHGISDIQLMLQPFARLFGVHNLDITAPSKVALHEPTVLFVRALKRCMQGKSQSDTFHHTSLNAQLEGMRTVHEDYMLKVLYGGAMVEDDKLEDLRDEEDDHDNNDQDDDGTGSHDGRRDAPDHAGDDNDDDDDGGSSSSDDDANGNDGPDAGVLKRELSLSPPSKKEAGDGRKRVHFSDEISSNGDRSGQGQNSHDSPNPRHSVYGSLFLATEVEIDFIKRFTKVCRASEGDARFWLSRADWNFDVAILNFVASLEAENPGEEDEIRRAIALSLEDMMMNEGYHPAPARNRDMRAGRELDNETSPTRSSRADGSSMRARTQNQPAYCRRDNSPSTHRVQQRRLLESHATQDEEAENAKVNGKGKGKAKKTDDDDDEEQGPSKDHSKHDKSIAKWNNLGNFLQQEDNYEPYNGYDTEMAGANYVPFPTAQPDAPDTRGDLETARAQGLPPADRNAQAGRADRFTALLGGWEFDDFNADARVRDSLNSSRYLSVDRPRSRSLSGAPGLVYGTDVAASSTPRSVYGQDLAALSTPDPMYGPDSVASPGRGLRRPTARPRVDHSLNLRPRVERTREFLLQRFNAIKEKMEMNLGTVSASDPDARLDVLQNVDDLLDSSRTARLGLIYDQEQPATPPPPARTIAANTVDDYPEWAGTSYWSAPATPAPGPAPIPAPVPELAASSSSVTNQALTSDFVPFSAGTTARRASDSPRRSRSSRFSRPIYPTQDEAYAATSPATAATAMSSSDTLARTPALPSAATTSLTDPSSQYQANQDYLANFRPEFGDEVLHVSSDPGGKL
jgi:hypothetical protein